MQHQTGIKQQTVLYDCHVRAGARIVEFSGWQMPVQYPAGIIHEHLATRRSAGLFDVSHMGRFMISGREGVDFLRRALTNDAAQLPVGRAQYTLLANETGGAIDDAFLYRLSEEKFILVVNASNAKKDWEHLSALRQEFAPAVFHDLSGELAMVALQGPAAERLLGPLIEGGDLPEPQRNAVAAARILGMEMILARTGYTGEPVCFEMFVPAATAADLWTRLIEQGAEPVGLGARDTLRLEAGLPLYGHEYGADPAGHEIPILSCPTAKFGIDLSDKGREFIGRAAIEAQQAEGTPRVIRQIRIEDKGLARAGAKVYMEGREIGWVTSGTMVPYWIADTSGEQVKLTEQTDQRAIGLALVDRAVTAGAEIELDVRGRRLKARVVKKNLQNRKGPVTFAVLE